MADALLRQSVAVRLRLLCIIWVQYFTAEKRSGKLLEGTA